MSDQNIVSVPLAVDIPPVPLRLRTPAMGKRAGINIADVSDEVLRAVGAKWTEKLIHEAAAQRANGPAKPKKSPAKRSSTAKK